MLEVTDLIPLQEIDLKIDQLLAEKKKLEEKLAKKESEIKSQTLDLEKKQQLLKHIQIRRNNNELELKSLTSKKQYLENKQLKANPTIYYALEKEIQDIASKIDQLELKILEDMEKIEALNSDIKKSQENIILLKDKFHQLQAQVNEEINKISLKISEYKTQRLSIASKIQSSLLETYENLRQTKKSKIIWDIDSKGCPACGMVLPESFINALVGKPNAEFCPYCGILLRWVGNSNVI